MTTACSVELIRWGRHTWSCPHEIKVRIHGLPGGAETLTRRLSNLRRAKRAARAVADGLGCTVTEIDMRKEVIENEQA